MRLTRFRLPDQVYGSLTRLAVRMTTRAGGRLAAFRADTGGNFAIIMAVCAIPLLLSAGIALDYSSAYMFRERLQDAVDAATLAAGHDITKLNDNELKKMVTDFIESNLSDGDLALVKNYNIDIDRTKLAIKVTADAKMPASFGPLVGINTLDYRAMASIQASSSGIEAMLVLDNTGSMGQQGKIGSLKKAARSFVSDMLALNQNSPDLVKIGIVPFAEYVNVGTTYENASWIDVQSSKTGYGWGRGWGQPAKWKGCVGSRDYPLNLKDSDYSTPVPGLTDVTCPSEITPLSEDEQELKKQINSFEPNGNTYIPAGLMWGMRALSSQEPFTQGLTKDQAAEKRVKKAIILMTDGQNTISKNPKTAYHDGYDTYQTDAWTTAACNEIKSQDIVIYTMTFGTGVPAKTKAMIKNCASDPKYYFDAANGDNLNAAFADIAASLAKLYLTQ